MACKSARWSWNATSSPSSTRASGKPAEHVEFGVTTIVVRQLTSPQTPTAFVNGGQGAHAVPLHLVDVIARIKRGSRRRQHRQKGIHHGVALLRGWGLWNLDLTASATVSGIGFDGDGDEAEAKQP